LSRLDQPHRFVLSYSYEFPFLREQHGIVGRIVGGWSMNGITVFGAGNPVSSALGYDLNGDGVGGDRPFLLDPSVLYHSIDNARIDPSTGRQFAMAQIPVTAFGPTAAEASARRWPWYPGTGFVGSAGRNIMRTQGQNNFDVVFQKNFRLFGKEHPHHLQYRAEFYNLFNHIQFDLPNTTLVDTGVVGYRLNPNWGQISAQRNGARSMQMMLRYMF
jgi:hypothetical protein